MWQSVFAMDAATFVTIAAKALAYLASLIAAGSALSLAGFSTLDVDTMRMVRRLGLAGAFVAGLASVAHVPMGAVYLAGGTWAGAFDPALTSMVAQSPIGESIVVRIAGLALIAALFVSRRTPGLVCVASAGIVCASFALRGHVMTEPRVVLGALVTAHLLGLAFWIGAFAPLHRLAGHADPMPAGAAADEFGRRALWVVPALVVAGGGLLVLLTGNPLIVLETPYGQLIAVKLSVFVLLLGLAARNRLRLTPALLAGDAGAGVRLRRSIGLEFTAVLAILITTATLTTIASPDMEG